MHFEYSRTRHINSYTTHLWTYKISNVNPSNVEDHMGVDQAKPVITGSVRQTAIYTPDRHLQVSLVPTRGHGN